MCQKAKQALSVRMRELRYIQMNIETENKLILLFVLDKLDIPVKEELAIEMCSADNNWIPYMECRSAFHGLIDADFIIESGKQSNQPFYSLTADGRACLLHFHKTIPKSLRGDITAYIKENRLNYRKKQEYVADYFKNPDGTYTVILKILTPSQTLMELKLNVETRHLGKFIYNGWENKAPQIYETLHEMLSDG